MKFCKSNLVKLTPAVAVVLSGIINAGSYTPHHKHHVETPVGSGVEGFSFYVGGGLSAIGGSAHGTQYFSGAATQYSHSNITGDFAAGQTGQFFVNSDITSTVNSLKVGGEAHLGAYVGVAENFGFYVEAFGVSRTSFNPKLSFNVMGIHAGSADDTFSITSQNNDAVSVTNTYAPTGLGYGVRLAPTVMLSDQFGMFLTVGYGSQKWQSTVDFSSYFGLANHSTVPVGYLDGKLQKSGNASGMNYGLGSEFKVDDNVSVFTSLEVQKFKTINVVKNAEVINTLDQRSASILSQTQVDYPAVITLSGSDSDSNTPSNVSFNLNTFTVGIDYAFV